jgi:AcrR family transcriptional regulator
MSPRSYDLGRRRGASEATRDRILEATRALFGGKGDLERFSMDAVAVRAGVSRMTVYNQFHSQGELLEAFADRLAERGEMRRLAGAFTEPRAEEAVDRFVRTFVGFWASDRVVLRRMRAMGVLVPRLYRKLRERDEWRREAARNLVAKLGVPAMPGRSGDPRATADLLATLTSFEVFDALCDDKRSPDDVARLLAGEVVRLWGLGRDSTPPLRRTGGKKRPAHGD